MIPVFLFLLIMGSMAVSFGGFLVLTADRGSPARFGVPELATYVRDGMARFVFIMLHPLRMRMGGPRAMGPAPHDGFNTRLPVLIVPTIGYNRSTLVFLRSFLVRRGWTHIWDINHQAGRLTLADHAEDLDKRVQELCRFCSSDRVDIVAHGLGGLIVAWYLRHRDGAARVRRLVTLGTPWQGSRMSVFLRGPHGRETLPSAHQLDSLTPSPVPTLSIWSPDDPFVIPSESALPEGVESVRLEAAGHLELLMSARAFRAVQAALEHPLREGPG